MKVLKSNKQLVRFDRNKIVQTCMTAGAPLKLSSQIASEVWGEGYDGMTTDEIRMRVYIKLKKVNPDVAEQYVWRSNMKVRTSSSSLEYFSSAKIVESLIKETHVDRPFAQSVAKDVEKELGRMRLNYVTAPLIREIVNVKLLERGMESVRARYTRLGMPVYDVLHLLENGSREIAQYSPEAVHKVMSDQIAREYALINVLPFDLADAHLSGQIHIHDLNYFTLRPTTFSHDLRFFLTRGLKVDGTGEYTATSGPAKRAQSAFMHALKVIIAGQTECSREQYIEDFNVILAPYIRGLGYDEVKQLMQMLLYEVSQTSVGKGGQAIYAAFSCDTSVPKHLAELPAVLPGGKVQKNITYADFADEAEVLFNALFDVAAEGDYINKPFIYPKLLVNQSGRRSPELMLKAAELAARFGLPYFMNNAKNYYGCRRGSAGYVSINLPRLGLKGGDVFQLLDDRMKKAYEVHLIKKRVLEKNLEHNLLPFLKQKAAGLRYFNPGNQRYVISYSGLNELAKMQSGGDLKTKTGAAFGQKVLSAMMKSAKTFSRESDLEFIVTGTPKGICYATFAALDEARFGSKARDASGGRPYYSKTHYVDDRRLREKLRCEGRLNRRLNGRSLTHLRISEGEHTAEDMLKFIERILAKEDVKYLTMSRPMAVCLKCGHVQASVAAMCMRCNSRSVSVWNRDTGHIQKLRTWTPAQRQAYVDMS
jgi:ribonucleoside-triphosphate reductase (formate)